MRRLALTLIEVIIAVAVFATLMGMAMQVAQGTAQMADDDAARDDLADAGRRALAMIADDLQDTAWFYDWVDANGNGDPDPGETVNYRMPWVNPPWTGPAGTADDGIANNLDGTPAPTPVAGVPSGDRLLFLRLQAGAAITALPARDDRFPFDAAAYAPVRMSRFMDAAPVPELMLNAGAPPGSDTNFLTQRWETDQANTWAENRDKARLRLFTYVLEPSRRTSMGRLVRRYRNAAAWALPLPASTFSEDGEMCDWVESVDFDTWRTLGTLTPNQVRVVLVLRRDAENGTGTVNRRRFEATFAMRSITHED